MTAIEASKPEVWADDFIGFDFGDEEGIGSGIEAEAGPSSRPTSPGSARGGRHQARGRDSVPTGPKSSRRSGEAANASSSKGKKRKIDGDGEPGDGDIRSKKDQQRAAARGTPWSVDVDWKTARNAAQQLHREMMAFERWIAPTKEEHQSRKMVIRLIRNAINSQWKDAEVHSFGSQDTELYLPQGDIDLVVVSRAMDLQRRENVLRAMAACLRRNNLATDVQVIAKAKVPIIKFVCTHGRYRCDISVNQTNGLKAADWVNEQQDKVPAIRPLIMLTKHLLQQRGMSEVYTGGLGSFSVILLVVNFMQMHPRVQRGEIDPARNLGVLFLDFLELYGKNFGYDDTGISVTGRGSYFHKSHRGWKDGQKPFKVSIEDPQNPENDIATGSYNIISVRTSLAGAFDILTTAVCERGFEMSRGRRGDGTAGRSGPGSNDTRHHRFEQDPDEAAREALVNGNGARNGAGGLEKDPQSLLGSIIGVSRELMKNRKDIEDLYHSGILQKLLGKSPPRRSPSPGPSHAWKESRRPPEPREAAPRQPSPPSPPSGPRAMSGRNGRDDIGDAGNSSVDSIIHIKGASSQMRPGAAAQGSHHLPPQHSTPLRTTTSRPSDRQHLASTAGPGRGSVGPHSLASDSGDDEPDSRYAAQASSRRGEQVKKRRRDFLDVPKAYVSEESEDEGGSEDASSSAEEGEVSGSQSAAQSAGKRKQSIKGASQQRFWLDKGAARMDDDDDDETDY